MNIIMKKLFVLTALLIISTATTAATFSPIGYWKTISDTTHHERTIIHITQNKQKQLEGRVLMGFPLANGDRPNPYCTECSGTHKNKRINTINILWGYCQSHSNPNKWNDGHVLDPEQGSTYNSVITMRNQNTLEIRGYILIRLLGRTQTWHRVTKQQYLEYKKQYPQPDIPKIMPKN